MQFNICVEGQGRLTGAKSSKPTIPLNRYYAGHTGIAASQTTRQITDSPIHNW